MNITAKIDGSDKQPRNLDLRPPGLSDRSLLSLYRSLQSTLDTATLVKGLFEWMQAELAVSSLEYSAPEARIELRHGDVQPHRAHYALRLEQRYLGKITLTSITVMSEERLKMIEQAIGVLVHHLKNALDYLSLEKTALYDPLTAVFNRTTLHDLMAKEVERAERYQCAMSVMMIDIDHFKSVNDMLGHLGGDKVLVEVARTIRTSLRSPDMTFRFGGDEFLVILPNTTLERAHVAAAKIMYRINERSIETDGRSVQARLSIGVVSRRAGESQQDLLARVDKALYAAKKAGRGCVR